MKKIEFSKKIKTAVLAFGLSASLLCQASVSVSAEETTSEIATNQIQGWPQGPEISSSAAVIIEESTGAILYSKNMNMELYPSSAVKIMTCLIALENSDLSDQVVMTSTGVSGVTDGGANIAAQLDETFTMEQCLYAIMVASANDIALQVAEHISGSVENFVAKMNERAKELGCDETIFTNPTGLPDNDQHVSAQDMGLIMKAAIKNETFRKIASTTSYTIPATNVSGGSRTLTSNFKMIDIGSEAYYEGCIGGKEGYTEASGSTLVCAATKNDMTLICVVLHGASEQTDDEASLLLDYGFNNFQKLSLEDDDFSIIKGGTVIVPNGVTSAELTYKDTEMDSSSEDDMSIIKYKRKYRFNDKTVGTAIIEAVQETTQENTIDGEANMSAAYDFSEKHTDIPYYIIGAVGGISLILLLVWMIKIIRS